MSGLKKKLGLYDFDRKPAADSPASIAKRNNDSQIDAPAVSPSASADLRFGPLALTRIAFGVYRYRCEDADPMMGRRRLSEYLPFRLSGILELALWPQPEALHPEDVLFLDTETTGLTRGAGTLPFLTGLASFESNRLVREVIFMSEPGGEEDYLDYLQETFRRFKYLVSYNGRAFDVPLLRNRLILNRKPGLPDFLHFDLLHIFRRLFPKGSLAGYRQMDLEERLLGYEREDDLPGSEIPQIYFDYVKYGHDGGLEKVFDHNLKDLCGMVLLFLEAIRVYDQRDSARGSLRSGLARILLRNRNSDEALELLNHLENDLEASDEVAEGDESEEDAQYADDTLGGLRYRDYLLLGQLYRARGRYGDAAGIFARVVARYDCPYARMALAKLLEHRIKDFPAALQHTDELIRRFGPDHKNRTTTDDNDSQEPGRGLYASIELQKRRARIEGKLRRAG